MRFQIQRVGAVIRDVIAEGDCLLLARTAGRSFRKRLASALNVDLDGHPAGPVIDDDARWVIEGKVKSGVRALNRN